MARAGEAGGRGAGIIVAGSRLLGGGNTHRALPERAELDGCTAPLAAELMAGCHIVSQQTEAEKSEQWRWILVGIIRSTLGEELICIRRPVPTYRRQSDDGGVGHAGPAAGQRSGDAPHIASELVPVNSVTAERVFVFLTALPAVPAFERFQYYSAGEDI